MTLALLHTSQAHVPVFDALRDLDHPGLGLLHLVRKDLLTRAREAGPDAVAEDVVGLLTRAVAEGADSVLCTCSTIGGVAESAAAVIGVPVLRVDRPMAAEAVRKGRVTVLATVAGTLGPTLDLLAEEAARAESVGQRPALVRPVLAEAAWQLFEDGDLDGYLDQVAAAVDAVTDADVIVLAQASMAGAVDRAATRTPVLASPRSGLAAAASR